MIALSLLAVAGIVLNYRAEVFYASDWHRGDPDPVQTLAWRRMPSSRELAAIVPRDKTGLGYGHIRCSRIARSGKMLNCVIDSQPGGGSTADPDFDRAALKAMAFFRASPQVSHDARPVRFVAIAIRFYIPGPDHGLGWGDCVPFCVIEPPAPPQ